MRIIINLLRRALGALHLTKIVARRAAGPLSFGCQCPRPRGCRRLPPLAGRRVAFLPWVLCLASVALVLADLPANAAGGSTPAILGFFAQVSPFGPIEQFLQFLSAAGLVIGAISIAYGGYLLASQGRIQDGLLAIFGGLVVALAVPLVRWFASLL